MNLKKVIIGKGTILITLHDITERKQAEEKVINSENRLQEAEQLGKLGHVDWVVAEQRSYWSMKYSAFMSVIPNSAFPVTRKL